MSQFTNELDAFAERLAKDGYPTAVIEQASARMKRLEEYIIKLHKEFYPNTVPPNKEDYCE